MKIAWSPEAIEDLVSLRAYIAEDNPAAARRTVQHIVESIEQLLPDNPRIGRAGRVPGTRELVIPRTPYIVPYRLQRTTIQILRVYHAARRWPDSFYWPLPRSSADRSIHSRGRSRLASRNRTPTPPPLSAMNSTASSACRTATSMLQGAAC